MAERAGGVTFKGNPLTVIGEELKAGQEAPDFALIANDMSTVHLKDSNGKVRILSVVPSLDTPVCDQQSKRFNEELGKLGDDVICYTISADLPFAQGRWCGATGCNNVKTLSDHREMSFGDKYGLHVKELRLLQRAVFVVDKDGKITYAEYVPEIAQHPDYEKAIEAAKSAS